MGLPVRPGRTRRFEAGFGDWVNARIAWFSAIPDPSIGVRLGGFAETSGMFLNEVHGDARLSSWRS